MTSIPRVYELCGYCVVIVRLLCGADSYFAPNFVSTWSEISNLLDI